MSVIYTESYLSYYIGSSCDKIVKFLMILRFRFIFLKKYHNSQFWLFVYKNLQEFTRCLKPRS